RIKAVSIDVTAVEELDTLGAWLLERLNRACSISGIEPRLIGLSEHYRGLIDEMRRVNRANEGRPDAKNQFLVVLDRIGRSVVGLRSDLRVFLEMLGALTAVIGRVALHPARLRLTSAVYHLFRVGWQAVPIMLLITFLIGGIIAQQGFFH